MINAYLPKQVQDFELSIFLSKGDDYKLMQKAAKQSSDWISNNYRSRECLILNGPGNNGGDGYHIGHNLRKNGFKVYYLDVLKRNKSILCQQAFDECVNSNLISLDFMEKLSKKDVLIIDAIFGIGGRENLSKEVEGLLILANQFENKIAIDTPTGLNAESGKYNLNTFKANHTITFIAKKIGQLRRGMSRFTGKIVLKELDLNIESMNKPACKFFRYKDITKKLPKRAQESHKGIFGKVAVVGGDLGYGGAGILAAETALSAGAGLVKLLTRKEYVAPALSRSPELMVIGTDNAQEAEEDLAWADVVICGPGFSDKYWSRQCLLKLLINPNINNQTIILDAGALRLLPEKSYKNRLPKNLILTPHPGEASSLLDLKTRDVQKDRIKTAKDIKKLYGGTIILKGHETVILDEDAYICSDGSPALAVPGSGDMLCGLLGALIANGMSNLDSSLAAVAVHAKSGDDYSNDIGSIGLTSKKLMDLIIRNLN